MNRQIKFRGQNIKGEWHYGFLSYNKDVSSDYEWFISNKAGKLFAFGAIEKSIGQFTGLYDKNGRAIYEGDILEDTLGRKKLVEYYKDGFWLNASLEGAEWCLRQVNSSSKVIGNIYENPELISKTRTHEH